LRGTVGDICEEQLQSVHSGYNTGRVLRISFERDSLICALPLFNRHKYLPAGLGHLGNHLGNHLGKGSKDTMDNKGLTVYAAVRADSALSSIPTPTQQIRSVDMSRSFGGNSFSNFRNTSETDPAAQPKSYMVKASLIRAPTAIRNAHIGMAMMSQISLFGTRVGSRHSYMNEMDNGIHPNGQHQTSSLAPEAVWDSIVEGEVTCVCALHTCDRSLLGCENVVGMNEYVSSHIQPGTASYTPSSSGMYDATSSTFMPSHTSKYPPGLCVVGTADGAVHFLGLESGVKLTPPMIIGTPVAYADICIVNTKDGSRVAKQGRGGFSTGGSMVLDPLAFLDADILDDMTPDTYHTGDVHVGLDRAGMSGDQRPGGREIRVMVCGADGEVWVWRVTAFMCLELVTKCSVRPALQSMRCATVSLSSYTDMYLHDGMSIGQRTAGVYGISPTFGTDNNSANHRTAGVSATATGSTEQGLHIEECKLSVDGGIIIAIAATEFESPSPSPETRATGKAKASSQGRNNSNTASNASMHTYTPSYGSNRNPRHSSGTSAPRRAVDGGAWQFFSYSVSAGCWVRLADLRHCMSRLFEVGPVPVAAPQAPQVFLSGTVPATCAVSVGWYLDRYHTMSLLKHGNDSRKIDR
jgi:hypothetical protein